MFDYESLQGLEAFRDVRLEPLPVSKENLFRTAYSGTHGSSAHVEGVVLLVLNEETKDIRQIHLYKTIQF